jgi:hypothetical protein
LYNNPFHHDHHIDTNHVSKPVPPVVEKAPEEMYSDFSKLRYCQGLFVNGSNAYEESTDKKFQEHVDFLYPKLYQKFSMKQLQSVTRIYMIGWPDFGDNVVGYTKSNSLSPKSEIEIAAECREMDEVMYHEVFHALHNTYEQYFKDEIQIRWMLLPDYVTTYARTNISEDFAETGAAFMAGDTLKENEKFELIREFLVYTK